MDNIRKNIVEIVSACDMAFLSTINLENLPETRCMDNGFNKAIDENLNIYFAYHTNSSKAEQVKRNCNGSLYYVLLDNMRNMTLFGKFEEVSDKSLKDSLWREELAQYYQHGKEDPQYAVLKFIPTSYKYYDGMIKMEGKL